MTQGIVHMRVIELKVAEFEPWEASRWANLRRAPDASLEESFTTDWL